MVENLPCAKTPPGGNTGPNDCLMVLWKKLASCLREEESVGWEENENGKEEGGKTIENPEH